jgi:hypothetical protein
MQVRLSATVGRTKCGPNKTDCGATVANYLTAIKKSITNSLAATVFDARGTKASTI